MDTPSNPDLRILTVDEFIGLTKRIQASSPRTGRPVEWLRSAVDSEEPVLAYGKVTDPKGYGVSWVVTLRIGGRRQYRMDVPKAEFQALRKPSAQDRTAYLVRMLQTVETEPLTEMQMTHWDALINQRDPART